VVRFKTVLSPEEEPKIDISHSDKVGLTCTCMSA